MPVAPVAKKPVVKSSVKLAFAIRSWDGEAFVDVWVLGREGPTEQSYLHGRVLPKTAEMLASRLGLPVQREHRTLMGDCHNGTPAIS
jgi:hypothetical protein